MIHNEKTKYFHFIILIILLTFLAHEAKGLYDYSLISPGTSYAHGAPKNVQDQVRALMNGEFKRRSSFVYC